jgi:protoheme IX farnesyltransferase
VSMTQSIRNYLLITKPWIVAGNLVAVAGGFFLASRGSFDPALLLLILISMSLVIASGCVFNNYIDRNLDKKMVRTRDRVLARGLISPGAALFYGSFLGFAGMILLWIATNGLCVAIVLAGFVIYVGVYSMYLKRRSINGTLIGSLAGAAPPLAGYCAVINRFDTGALILLLIFSLWQMPHSYAIAIFRYRDYAVAAIPVLPVRLGIVVTKKVMIVYISFFILAAMMLTFGGYTGYLFLTVAVLTGLIWLYTAWAGYRTSDDLSWSRKLFISSIVSITVLCIMMSIDFTPPAAREMLLAFRP